MGKQINYFMDYETFRSLAQKALDLGATIIPGSTSSGLGYGDISCVKPNTNRYLFFFPEYANGATAADGTFSDFGNAAIEAGFSAIQGRTIHRERMYISTGYYNTDGCWIPRPKEMDRIYGSLVRFAKKQMLYKVCRSRSWKDYITSGLDELVTHHNYILSDS